MGIYIFPVEIWVSLSLKILCFNSPAYLYKVKKIFLIFLLFLIFISSWFTGNKNRSFRYFCVYLSINLVGRALDRKETKLKLEIVSEE